MNDPDRWVEAMKLPLALRLAEDPMFQELFDSMARAAMAHASQFFFVDLERHVERVFREIATEQGLASRPAAPRVVTVTVERIPPWMIAAFAGVSTAWVALVALCWGH